MTKRIIPRLDIKGGNIVKGIQLEGLRVLGKPELFARHYYESGADELLYMDIVASLYQRNSLLDIVEKTSREIFIPLTVGGGLRSVDDIRAVLRAGADKVSLNTAAIGNPQLIEEAARSFGSSTIVVSIETKRQADGSYEAYIDNGRERTGVEVLDWVRRVVDLGAGEIILTSVDREGTGDGYDIELVRTVAEMAPIPVIACGGAGAMADIGEVLVSGKADAVSVASVLHYNFVRNHDPFEGNEKADVMGPKRKVHTYSKIADASLPELKDYLVQHGVDCRHTLKTSYHG
jgi:imidazole glycerol-phosphate synthase subunit HisF